MNLSAIISRVRILKASPSTSRWNDGMIAALVNQAQLQLALEVDFPAATLIIPANLSPTNVAAVIVGTPGATQIAYAVVSVASTGGGDSAPSPTVVVSNAPDTLSGSNYVNISFNSIPGTTYTLLRQVNGVDVLPQLLTQLVASGSSSTFSDQGGFSPAPYRVTNGCEYQLPDLVKILRAYIQNPTGGQQPLIPSDITYIGGEINDVWDQSSGTIQGFPTFSPQWLVQGPVPYPVQSAINNRVQVATPWHNVMQGSQRPIYALRGGYMIVLPAPQTACQIIVEIIPKPPPLVYPSDLSTFPDAFLDCICWKVMEYMAISDDDSRDADFSTRFAEGVKKLRIAYVDTIQANKPQSIVPMTIRTQMREWPI